eukprot:TRINITY_DN1544_c0_g1_i6.p1 TRINITY_DN1544_c0_g1~~TRINITY_DN1544_c0_g1_i6.p1  ORF type:complete len:323 (+),score=111.13 TRINITY_DN1544_c0_g1_i6:113-1081(+)
MQQPSCKAHPTQVLHKFCKNADCWTLLCPKCAAEHHRNHNIVEYGILSYEARSAKEKLLQAKKGDLMSIKRLLDGIDGFKGQLNDTQEKRREEANKLKINVANRIDKIVNEDAGKCGELVERLIRLQSSLKDFYEGQSQEMSKIPELADAVISKGTIEDLRTFFEMCQNGVETDAEIVECKKEVDLLREAIEEFVMVDPLFEFDKALYEEPKTAVPFQLEVLTLLSEEKKLQELLSSNLAEKDSLSPSKKLLKMQDDTGAGNGSDTVVARTSSSSAGKSKVYPRNIITRGLSSKKSVGQRPFSTRNNPPGFFKGYSPCLTLA